MGASFFQPNAEISGSINDLFSSIVWLVGVCSFVHIFKYPHTVPLPPCLLTSVAGRVFFLTDSVLVFQHERANSTYAVLPYFLAELACTLVFFVVFFTGPIVGAWSGTDANVRDHRQHPSRSPV